MKKTSKNRKKEPMDPEEFPLPIYAEGDDIYNKEKKIGFEEEGLTEENKLNVKDNNPAGDLDIPGSELDDAEEEIGEEDEENNYYSLGGDRHEDLEEERE